MNKKIFDLIKFVNDENFQNLPEYLLNDFSLLALGGQTCKKLFFEKRNILIIFLLKMDTEGLN